MKELDRMMEMAGRVRAATVDMPISALVLAEEVENYARRVSPTSCPGWDDPAGWNRAQSTAEALGIGPTVQEQVEACLVPPFGPAQRRTAEPLCACAEVWPGQGHPPDCPRVLAGLETAGGPAQRETTPEPRFGDRLRRDGIAQMSPLLARRVFALADAIDADQEQQCARLVNRRVREIADLRQRIEAAMVPLSNEWPKPADVACLLCGRGINANTDGARATVMAGYYVHRGCLKTDPAVLGVMALVKREVERLSYVTDEGPGEGLVSVPGEDYSGPTVVIVDQLLAALAEIFGPAAVKEPLTEYRWIVDGAAEFRVRVLDPRALSGNMGECRVVGTGEWLRYEGQEIYLEFLRLASGGAQAPQGER